MIISKDPQDLINTFQAGGVIAYPTEAIYGFGCNPDNEQAVLKLLDIKKRSVNKGLILVAAHFDQIEKYLKPLSSEQYDFTLPNEITYIFPALESSPKWLTGDFDSLAIRISKHPLVNALCSTLDSALVSTSANLSGEEPAETCEQVESRFKHTVDAILDGEVGNSLKPSAIFDIVSGKFIRT